MRKGVQGLAAAAEQVLRKNPCSGAVFAFRGRKGDRIKLLYWDQQGFCLYYKVLQNGRFPWPSPADGVVRLTSAQLAMLWEGIDWRRVRRPDGLREKSFVFNKIKLSLSAASG